MEQLIKKLLRGYHTLEELNATKKQLRELADAGYHIQSHTQKGKKVFYILTGSENCSVFLSGVSDKPQTFRWLELSDTHSGSIQFDKSGLIYILKRAEDEGIKEVHLSGDLCDGINIYKGHMNNIRYWLAEDQANNLAEILQEFKFRYSEQRYFRSNGHSWHYY